MMKLLTAALVCLSLTGTTALAAPSLMPEKTQLIGKWTHKRLEQRQDGKLVHVMDGTGDTAIEFKGNGTWALTTPTSPNSGTYSWIDRKSIDTVITASRNSKQIGWRSVKLIDVDANTLKIVTKYDDQAVGELGKMSADKPPPKLIVTSVFERATPAPKR